MFDYNIITRLKWKEVVLIAIALRDCHVRIYKTIKRYYKKHGYSPTIREIQKMCG
jgi:sulfur relay (sulfurtransferase) DsrC/TusE family protein